jgi:hypothetical protein
VVEGQCDIPPVLFWHVLEMCFTDLTCKVCDEALFVSGAPLFAAAPESDPDMPITLIS